MSKYTYEVGEKYRGLSLNGAERMPFEFVITAKNEFGGITFKYRYDHNKDYILNYGPVTAEQIRHWNPVKLSKLEHILD